MIYVCHIKESVHAYTINFLIFLYKQSILVKTKLNRISSFSDSYIFVNIHAY
jgi:hypothetical protein